MPEEVREAALEELSKMNSQQQGSPEISVIQNHLDFMLALPWKHEKTEDPDLVKARQILNEDHYGLEKVKKRILEHLAVMKLRRDNKGSILLLVGPPGTGKTSLGRSIARALDRKYVRLSLGGIRDESEIRGHRRTYVGAMPGRILNGMKQAGATNPVMVLDEVDKLMAGGFSGDPSAALLEVLDPEQNSTFTDHYLDLPYDLSEVFFIATANTIDTIPGPLLDRMEVISISSYTEAEKYHIAAEHLLPEVLEETGLSKDQIEIPEDVLRAVITDYTREGGVRGLKKQLLAIARSVSAELVTGMAELPRVIRKEELEELTGHRPAFHDKTGVDNPPGVVTGLAWTAVGGEILFIETQDMPGSGQVILTGQLGDVMQESARISLSLLKSRLPLSTVNFKERDVHIHVPSGAVPKDGPSAGITIFTALASLFTGHKVDPHLAMTGEITLRGAVMPIGGLKEKLLAALRAGITKALIPKDNEADLREVPDEVKEKMTIIPVATVEDVLRETIGISLPKMEHMLYNGAPGALRSDLTQN
jgi:ATP-dependent Lon protease